MNKVSRLLFLVILGWLLGYDHPLRADCPETALLENASAVLTELVAMPCNRIPMSLLQKAQGVAIFPHLIKVAVGVGGRHGRGVLLMREPDGSWGPPTFLTLSAASAGIQLGVEKSDLVLLLWTRGDLECLKKGKLTLGLGNTLAIGSFGRDKVLGTDLGLQTGIVSGSPCKGLFAGWCVQGSSLHLDAAANAAYGQYEQGYSPKGGSPSPGVTPALQLQIKLAQLSAPAPTLPVGSPYSGVPAVASHP